MRWLGKQDGRDRVQAAIKGSASSTANGAGSRKAKGGKGGRPAFASLSKAETRRAVQHVFQAFSQGSGGGGGKKPEPAAGRDILVDAIVKNLGVGSYARTAHSLSAAAKGKVVPLAASSLKGSSAGAVDPDDAVKVETHGLVSFAEDGTCGIPRKALEDPNQLKSLASKAVKFVELVRGTCERGKDSSMSWQGFSKLELDLRAHTLALSAAKVKRDVLSPLEATFGGDRANLERLARAKRPGGAAKAGLLGRSAGQDSYSKAVEGSLAIQVDLYTTQQKVDAVNREIQEIDFLSKVNQMKGDVPQERVARVQQLLAARDKVLKESEENIKAKLPVVMGSWTLLLQSYYQHLIDRVYQKNKDLMEVLDALPEGADQVTPEKRKRLEGHWQKQLDSVSKYLNDWQAAFSGAKDAKDDAKEGGKAQGPMTFEQACAQMNKARDSFREWVGGDLTFLEDVAALRQVAEESLMRVQIVEIDSDDSESEYNSDEEEAEDQGPVDLNLKSFEDLDLAIKAANEEVGSKERGLTAVAAAYDRSRLGMHQVALAYLVSEVYSQVVDLFSLHEADKGMQLLLQGEEQKRMKKERAREKERERAGKSPVSGNGLGSGGKTKGKDAQADEPEDLGEVVIDEAFSSYSLFSVLGETGETKKKFKKRVGKKAEKPREEVQPPAMPKKEKPKAEKIEAAGSGNENEKAKKAARKNKKKKQAVKAKEPVGALGEVQCNGQTEETEQEDEEARHLKMVLAKRRAHLHLSVELAKAELYAAQKKYEKAQHQLERFNEIISS